MQGKPMLMPAVWGGLSIGILSTLPFVSAFNVCCCGWVITGGVLAAYILQANSPQPISNGDGAVVGLLAGAIGALVAGALSLPINMIFGPLQQRVLMNLISKMPNLNLPPEFQEGMMKGSQGPESAAAAVMGMFVTIFVMAFVGAIFATVGGLLGAVFFKKKVPAIPPPPYQDPPPYMQQ